MMNKMHNFLNTNDHQQSQSPEMKKLALLAESFEAKHLSELFAEDPARFQHFSESMDDLIVDFSKQRLSLEVKDALMALASADRKSVV